MIREEDVREAIAEMQGQKNPNASTCIKLAAYYTILDHIVDQQEPSVKIREPMMYSGSAPDVIEYDGDSDFAKALRGKSQKDVLPVIDELMTTLQVMHPRLYAGVMARI